MNLLSSDYEIRNKLTSMPSNARDAVLNFASLIKSSPPTCPDDLGKAFVVACATAFQTNGGNLNNRWEFDNFMQANSEEIATVAVSILAQSGGVPKPTTPMKKKSSGKEIAAKVGVTALAAAWAIFGF